MTFFRGSSSKEEVGNKENTSEKTSPIQLATSYKVMPQHVAIIMDGNGRWAEQRGLSRSAGHARGTSSVKEIIREADRLGISFLTLYCFSTENWGRPVEEISILMGLLKDYLLQEKAELIENNIKLSAFGQTERIPTEIREILMDTIEATKNNTGMKLNFCISYGGRAEILAAAQKLAREVKVGMIEPHQITEDLFSKRLFTGGIPDPDLVIRTSGEFRISNFLLWQLAYAEFYVTETLWPDFQPSHLRAALESFAQRKRRFGRSDESEKNVQSL
jgi:undecaprenyl diphosphate synthase